MVLFKQSTTSKCHNTEKGTSHKSIGQKRMLRFGWLLLGFGVGLLLHDHDLASTNQDHGSKKPPLHAASPSRRSSRDGACRPVCTLGGQLRELFKPRAAALAFAERLACQHQDALNTCKHCTRLVDVWVSQRLSLKGVHLATTQVKPASLCDHRQHLKLCFCVETEAFPDRPVLDEIDGNVLSCLPPGACIVQVAGSGASHWTRTARLDLALQDGTEISIFLKVAENDNGMGMMKGEYESMKAIVEFIPNFVPHPISWGTFASNPDLHFMISHFRGMDRKVPEKESTCAVIAQLHLESHSAGITKFGFPMTTHNGNLAQDNTWCNTWEEFYVQQLRGMLSLEEESQGPQTEEMQELLRQIFAKVIPRLLRPMETDGHSITPSLLHGDFWHGNVSTDVDTGEPVTYDASSFWGHNEYDIRTMNKHSRYKFGPTWQQEYLKHYPAAYPQEDFEARSELYLLRSKVHDAALFSSNVKFREILIEHARSLVQAYGEGYEAWLVRRAGNRTV